MNKKLCKALLILPLVFFADWIIMVIFGCFASTCNAKNAFFCSVYCYFGLSLILISLIVAGYFIFKSSIKKGNQ